jgi:squalene-hopene/tetraprenyl-beta-curcumene cyclase
MKLPDMKTLLCFLGIAAIAAAAPLPSQTDISLRQEVARAQERGMVWLVKQQEADGSWRHHPAITGLALTALARSENPPVEAMSRAAKFILSHVKTNGAIYGGGDTDKYPNYSTAICAMALLATGDAAHTETIRNARRFLIGSQFDEGEGYQADSPSYGGIGYGKRERPDLSNTQWALEAIRLTESLETQAGPSPHKDSRLHWQRAVQFLQRCQNLPASNDQPWAKEAATNDLGGFIYMPGDPAKKLPPLSFADDEVMPTGDRQPLRSYGSMTYAGLKSYLYAELKKDDPRVKAAVDWLRRNYTLDENPGLGAQGLFYYLHTITKALTAYGADTFTDAAGKMRDWRYELMKKFVNLQKADGFWQNDNNRWWENDPVLCTSYSLIALEILQTRRYP